MSNILSVVIILFESICSKIYFDSILIKRNGIYHDIFILISISVPGFFASTSIKSAWVKSILIILLYFAVSCIYYERRFLICICSSIILYITTISLDYFSILLLMAVFSVSKKFILSNILLFLFATMISKIILFIGVITFKKLMDRNKAIYYTVKRDWLIPIMQSVISIIVFMAIIEQCTYSNELTISILFAALGLLFSTLLVFYLMDVTARYRADAVEKALIRKQLKLEMESIVTLKSSYEAQRRFMHDYKNHMLVVNHMINAGEYSKALSYINSFTGEIYYNLYSIKTNHDIIDVILNYKEKTAQKNGIRFEIRAGDLSQLNIPTEDLVVIISNILDNAIEACEKVNVKKVIKIKIIIENGVFIFSVLNPTIEKVEIIENKIKSTKKDDGIHGIGILSVAQSLERCNGDYEMGCDGNNFQFTAIIRL